MTNTKNTNWIRRSYGDYSRSALGRRFVFGSVVTVVAAGAAFGCTSAESGSEGSVASALATPDAHASPPSPETRVQLTLPEPTGPHRIGTVSLHLVDPMRQDPYWTTPRARELMISIWYPARRGWSPPRPRPADALEDSWRSPGGLAPWMPPRALAPYRAELESLLSSLPTGPVDDHDGGPPDASPPPEGDVEAGAPLPPTGEQISLAGVDFPLTHARLDAPVELSRRPYPVVIFSPGYASPRELGTSLVEDLASHGYIVVTISHTFEATAVEFPGRRVELGRPDFAQTPHKSVVMRRDDTLFVVDKLQELARGKNPDADRRALPIGLWSSIDTSKIGMFGHSAGGATTAQSMANDERVLAGVDLDGSFFPDFDVLEAGAEEVTKALALLASRLGTRPFMIIASGGFGPDYFGNLTSAFWYHLRGWRRFLSLVDSTHFTFTDHTPLLNQLEEAGTIPFAAPQVGTIDPRVAVDAQRTYLRAFFDRALKNVDSHLLDGPSPLHPFMRFY